MDVIIPFIFGVLTVFLFDLTLNYEGWSNPLHARGFRGIYFLSFIFAIIMLRKKEWEELKLIYMFLFGMFVPVIIIEASVLAVFGSIFLFLTESQMILDLILMSGMLALGIMSYIKQRS